MSVVVIELSVRYLNTGPEDRLMATVLSVNRQPALIKCWKMASFFEKLMLVLLS